MGENSLVIVIFLTYFYCCLVINKVVNYQSQIRFLHSVEDLG